MPNLETYEERKFASWVKEVRKEVCWKLNPLGAVGLPDRIIVGKDRLIFFIEFKRGRERPRKIQKFVHDKLRSFGFNVYVCYSCDEAKEAYVKERAAV